MEEKVEKANNNKEPKFNKSQWLKAKKFLGLPDILMACLDDSKTYTQKEVEKAVEAFLKGGI